MVKFHGNLHRKMEEKPCKNYTCWAIGTVTKYRIFRIGFGLGFFLCGIDANITIFSRPQAYPDTGNKCILYNIVVECMWFQSKILIFSDKLELCLCGIYC